MRCLTAIVFLFFATSCREDEQLPMLLEEESIVLPGLGDICDEGEGGWDDPWDYIVDPVIIILWINL